MTIQKFFALDKKRVLELLFSVSVVPLLFLCGVVLIPIFSADPPPTKSEILQQAMGQAMFNSDMRMLGFSGLVLPPPGRDGRIHLSPEARAKAQADYQRLLNLLTSELIQPDPTQPIKGEAK